MATLASYTTLKVAYCCSECCVSLELELPRLAALLYVSVHPITSTFIAPTQTSIKNHFNILEQRTGTPYQAILRALPPNAPLKLVLSQFCNIYISFCLFLFLLLLLSFVFEHTVNAIKLVNCMCTVLFTSHKKVFRMKTSACRDGTLKNQPNKMGTTPQHIYTIPTSCAILPTMHNKKLSTHSLNEHGTQHCSLHSLEHERQSIPDSATFSSNKISRYLKPPTYHADPALLTVSVYKTDYTCHAQQQLHWLQSILFSNQMLYWKKADVSTANSAPVC